MNTIVKKEFSLISKAGKPFLCDLSYHNNPQKKPLIIFTHGFKGFKDWGFFNLMSRWFAENGCCFLKMNFSYNGTTLEKPLDFADLDAFGNNNFSKELLDIDTVLDYLHAPESPIDRDTIDLDNITLVGHSKGGATTIIKAFEDDRIHKSATLAAVLDIKKRYATQDLEQWKKDGALFVHNSRTEQNMPIYYQLVEDILKHERRFDLSEVLKKIKKPLLLIHPAQDETVPIIELEIAKRAKNDSITIVETDGSHTLDGSHPYLSNQLPENALAAFQHIKKFILDYDTSGDN